MTKNKKRDGKAIFIVLAVIVVIALTIFAFGGFTGTTDETEEITPVYQTGELEGTVSVFVIENEGGGSNEGG